MSFFEVHLERELVVLLKFKVQILELQLESDLLMNEKNQLVQGMSSLKFDCPFV